MHSERPASRPAASRDSLAEPVTVSANESPAAADMHTSAPSTVRAFVIGHPIAHSRSPLLHGHWLAEHGIDGSYERIDVPPEALADFLGDMPRAGFAGGNVTVPHKTQVARLVDRIDPDAAAVGAVNTLWREGDRVIGGNTDVAGFLANLDAAAPGWDAVGGRALVLGAGGGARAVVYALGLRGIDVVIVNRTAESAEALAARAGRGARAGLWNDIPRLLGDTTLLVNTTALGMQGKPPLALDLAPLPAAAVVHDIVYVPLETDLLAAARRRGLRAVDGLGMLLHQAVPGFERWFGVRPAVTPALRRIIEADIAR